MAVIIDVVLWGLAVSLIMWEWSRIRRKTVWIVEDSKDDADILQKNISFNHCKVIHKPHLKGIIADMAIKRPDAVIIDYRLSGTTNGDVLLSACELNGIPCILVTGYEGEIIGVDNSKIIRKCDDDSLDRLQSWVDRVVA